LHKLISRYRDHIRSFSPNARLFLAAMTVLAFGTGAPTIFFNLYLQQLGFDRAFIGGVNTAIQLGGAITAFPSALLLDRIGRRRAIPIALGIGLLSWSASLFTTRGDVILVLQAINGFGTVLFGLAVVPLLAESSTPRERTTLFSVQEGLITLALFTGTALFGYVPMWLAPVLGNGAESVETYRTVLLISAVIRVAGLVPFFFLRDVTATPEPAPAVADTPVEAASGPPRPQATGLARYYKLSELLKLKTPILLFVIPYSIVYFGGSLIFPFQSLFFKERFGISDGTIGVVLGLINLSIGVGALLGPILTNSLGRSRTVVLGTFISALGIAVMGFGVSFGLVAAMVILRAGLFNLTLPIYRAFVIDRTPRAEYTIVALLLSGSANVGPAIAPALSGWVQREVGFSPIFAAAVALYALAGLAYILVFARTRHHPKHHAEIL